MTKQEINIALAEFEGWRSIEPHTIEPKRLGMFGINPKDKTRQKIPNYYEDLNAVHRAETKFFKDKNTEPIWIITYVKRIYLLMFSKGMDEQTDLIEWMFLINATASQRYEALLRTIGKWKD